MTINLDRISLILVDAAAANHSFISGGTTKFDTSLTPRSSGYIRKFPVRKFADIQPVNYVYVPHDEEANGPLYPNATNGRNGNGDGGNNGGYGNGDGGSDGGNGDGDGGDNGGFATIHPMFDLTPPIRIHRIQSSSNVRSPIIFTNIFANHYGSWNALARAIYQIWLVINNRNDDLYAPDPCDCWPGCSTEFGRFEDDTFFICGLCIHGKLSNTE